MANAEKLMPFILQWEGGFVDDPDDRGGATNKGVTLTTFRQYYGQSRTVDDLRNITEEQWLHIFKCGYWDKMKGDDIDNQSVANILVDWAYNSGPKTPSKAVQRIVGATPDGIIGRKTLSSINSRNPEQLFSYIKQERIDFYNNICEKNPSQRKFLKGWMNRVNSLHYEG